MPFFGLPGRPASSRSSLGEWVRATLKCLTRCRWCLAADAKSRPCAEEEPAEAPEEPAEVSASAATERAATVTTPTPTLIAILGSRPPGSAHIVCSFSRSHTVTIRPRLRPGCDDRHERQQSSTYVTNSPVSSIRVVIRISAMTGFGPPGPGSCYRGQTAGG